MEFINPTSVAAHARRRPIMDICHSFFSILCLFLLLSCSDEAEGQDTGTPGMTSGMMDTDALVGVDDVNSFSFDFGLTEPKFAEYQFTWDRSNIIELDNGRWQTTNNLGYEVQIDGGWLVSYAATFVPCRSASKERITAPNGILAFVASLMVSTARAGHGDVADPSAMSDGTVETIGGPHIRVRVGPIPNAQYCDLHYLVARGDAVTARLNTAPDMIGTSLKISGRYRGENESEFSSFSISTDIAFGTLHSAQAEGAAYFAGVSATVDGNQGLGVHLSRPMGTLFDDIAFGDLRHNSIARIILRNLVMETSFRRYP